MAYFLVRARPMKELLPNLLRELETGQISELKPFGESLQYSLKNAKIDESDGYAIWVEEDYCSPPLKEERASVLDKYFEDISVERVDLEEKAWNKIGSKPSLFSRSK